MFGLRSKILFGFAGLLIVVIVMGVLSALVVEFYVRVMTRTFHEDTNSVLASQRMKEYADELDGVVQEAFFTGVAPAASEIDRIAALFANQFDREVRSITLPGETETVDELAKSWARFLGDARTIWGREPDPAVRRAKHAGPIHQESLKARALAQHITELNLDGILSEHSRAVTVLSSAKWAIYLLTLFSFGVALLFASTIGRFILNPIRLLTSSVQQIERGNLDLSLEVRSRDELGLLAASFNAMTAKLRDYRRQERDRLVRTERTTQLAIDSLPDAVVVTNADGQIELANQRARQLMETGGEAMRATLGRRVIESQDAAADSGYRTTIEVGDGEERRHLLPRHSPILDERGHVIGHTVVLADVTELRRLDEMKNGLLSLVSHELKTPLTSIRMGLHLVTKGKLGPVDPRQVDMLTTARDETERLHQIVENLLDMDRIESGKALMDLQPVSPAELVRRATRPVEATFVQQRVSLEIDVPGDLPSVSADPMRIGHVISNLLQNALRHTPEGGSVFVSARPAGGFVEFFVRDTGPGIPPQYALRIFERFFRAPGQTRVSGSGLGLAICKDIIEAHHGQIALRSEKGDEGAAFSFTIPLALTA
jgi:NtrC-family two-component system sensor histidine kinase KinB